MKYKYNFEIGIHFKNNITLSQKQNLYHYIENYIIDLEEKESKNKNIVLIHIYTNQIFTIKRILEKSKIIRFFYIEDIKK